MKFTPAETVRGIVAGRFRRGQNGTENNNVSKRLEGLEKLRNALARNPLTPQTAPKPEPIPRLPATPPNNESQQQIAGLKTEIAALQNYLNADPRRQSPTSVEDGKILAGLQKKLAQLEGR